MWSWRLLSGCEKRAGHGKHFISSSLIVTTSLGVARKSSRAQAGEQVTTTVLQSRVLRWNRYRSSQRVADLRESGRGPAGGAGRPGGHLGGWGSLPDRRWTKQNRQPPKGGRTSAEAWRPWRRTAGGRSAGLSVESVHQNNTSGILTANDASPRRDLVNAPDTRRHQMKPDESNRASKRTSGRSLPIETTANGTDRAPNRDSFVCSPLLLRWRQQQQNRLDWSCVHWSNMTSVLSLNQWTHTHYRTETYCFIDVANEKITCKLYIFQTIGSKKSEISRSRRSLASYGKEAASHTLIGFKLRHFFRRTNERIRNEVSPIQRNETFISR